ncbi:MAG: F0F1 ATP synthase subunit B [Nitratireductor sp.]|jgi:F-type H+-transporting ATPase subunit b|nr:F0F1 ATP synthase subunit B [Nitratireductor sp.]
MKIAFAIAGEAHAASTEAGTAAAPVEGEAGTHGGTETQAGTEVAHGAEGGHGGGAFPPFDPASFASQLLWLAITFGIFYLLMARVAIPRLGSILHSRKARIDQDISEANRLRDEAEHASAAYELELTEARNRAGSIGAKARDEAKAAAEAERHRVEAELNARLAEAEERIAAIKSKAMKEVGTIASDTTSTIVRELLGTKVTDAEIAAAIGKR